VPRRIALTPGEPSGIGPDLAIMLAQEARDYELVAIADPDLLSRRAALLGLPLELQAINLAQTPEAGDAGTLRYQSISLAQPEQAGVLNPANAPYVLQTLDEAVRGCATGDYDALVTGPVHKGVINEAGIAFTGHTEYLAQNATDSPADDQQLQPVMMLATRKLRVALATTHLPLKDVSAAITTETLITKLAILDRFLRYNAGIRSPKILVCGLNPHAGENGALGDEEINIITPALNTLRDNGLDLVGPLPADTLFTPQYLDDADAVFAMYHDQGLPVLKYSGFGKAVNITLGLPFIRTSVDHGTALGLAGSGQANSSSLFEAIDMAIGLTATAA